jgi:Ca-activated chloride channel family protein
MPHPIRRALVCPLLLLPILAYGGWPQSVGPAPDLLDNNSIAVAQIRRSASPSILSVSSNLVLIDVSVLDQEGRPVRGLPAAAFHLFERGAEQQILSVNETEVPISVIIVLDESGSMGKGVTRCVQAVKQLLRSSTESDEFALISFSDRVVLESDFTTDAGTIQARLMGAASHGRTALLDAVERAAMLVRRAHNQRRVILVLSDGGDNRSRYREAEVRRALLETPAQLYALSIAQFFQDESTAFGPDLLNQLCYVSGGRNVAVDDRLGIDREMARVNDEIRAEYVLAYSPQHVMRDGKFHRVSLRFARPPGIKPVSMSWRLGYYDPLE